ncbi:MAG: DUF4198 domain-containing protein [Gemmatimonadota bacterium]|nr:DUF4198 domain-containing protein [Gemmatimonadota bacterium]
MLTMKSGTSHSTRPAGRRFAVVGVALVLTLAVAAVASAHDTWLISETNSGRVGAPVQFDLTSGETFPIDDFAIVPTRVARALVREASFTRALARPTTSALALEYRWTPKFAGVATVGVELHPTTLVLEPKLIDEYLGEIDASEEVRAIWKSLGTEQKWTESYTKHAMTFVRVAPAKKDSAWTADKSWTRPLGLGLEFLPERDPTALRAGDTLIVRVLQKGVPLAGFSVGAIREGRGKAIFFKTDKAGRAGVVVDADGRWLINGTNLRRATTGTTVWESDFVTATLHVAPRS